VRLGESSVLKPEKKKETRGKRTGGELAKVARGTQRLEKKKKKQKGGAFLGETPRGADNSSQRGGEGEGKEKKMGGGKRKRNHTRGSSSPRRNPSYTVGLKGSQ